MRRDDTIWARLEECVRQLDEPFQRSAIVGWFRRHYPEVNESSLGVHIQSATANAPQPIAGFAGRTPLLVRVDRGTYRRHGPTTTLPKDAGVEVGDELVLGNGRRVTVTATMREAVIAARAALIVAAQRRSTVTYAELAEALDDRYLARGLGPLLEVLGRDCDRRGEPDLAALVVGSASGVPGEGRRGGALPVQKACFERWGRA